MFSFVISPGGCSSFCSLFCFVSCCAVLLQQRNSIKCSPLERGRLCPNGKDTSRGDAFIPLSIQNQTVSLKWCLDETTADLTEGRNGPNRTVFKAEKTCCLSHQFIHPNPLDLWLLMTETNEKRESVQSCACAPRDLVFMCTLGAEYHFLPLQTQT